MRFIVVFCVVFAAVVVVGGNPVEKKIREVKVHASNGRVKSSNILNKVNGELHFRDIELEKIIPANEYLISNWKSWFSTFDHDKDGQVRFADLELARNKFIKLHHLKAERKRAVIEIFTNWWSEYVMWGKSEITEEEFVNFQNKAFQADKGKFVERMQRNEEIICALLDNNRDGFVSEEEFIILNKAGGHGNVTLLRKFFETFNPVDGKVLAKTLAEEWATFLTREDSSKPDVVKTAFEGGI